MRRTRLWAQLLGVRGVIVGGIEVEEDDDGEIAGLIVSARLRKAEAGRCGVCRRRSGGARLPLPQPSGRGELAGHRCERHHHLITVQTRSSAHRAIPHRFRPPPRRRVRRA